MIKQISTEATYPLRHQILAHGQSIEEVGRPGDDNALHFGYFKEQSLVGIISLYPQNEQQEYSQKIWRIRGMAVDSKQQGRGIGSSLLDFAEKYLFENYDLDYIWCNARTSASKFYKNMGYTVTKTVRITYPYEGESHRMLKPINS